MKIKNIVFKEQIPHQFLFLNQKFWFCNTQSNTKYTGVEFNTVEFVGCCFEEITFNQCFFYQTKFINCTFNDCYFLNSNFKNIHFIKNTFNYTDIMTPTEETNRKIMLGRALFPANNSLDQLYFLSQYFSVNMEENQIKTVGTATITKNKTQIVYGFANETICFDFIKAEPIKYTNNTKTLNQLNHLYKLLNGRK